MILRKYFNKIKQYNNNNKKKDIFTNLIYQLEKQPARTTPLNQNASKSQSLSLTIFKG